MSHVTRRGFLKTSSAGAVAIGALGALPGLAAAQQQPDGAAQPVVPMGSMAPSVAATTLSDPFAVFIRNPAAGELTLMVGDREVVYTDPALVQRLWDASNA